MLDISKLTDEEILELARNGDISFDFLCDPVVKHIFDISNDDGYNYTKSFLELVLGRPIKQLYTLPTEHNRVVNKGKTVTFDNFYHDGEGLHIDYEIQKRLSIKAVSGKTYFYLGHMIVGISFKGKDYDDDFEAVQIILYAGRISDEDKLVIEHQFRDSQGKTKLKNNVRTYFIQLGALPAIIKKKGLNAKNYTVLERRVILMAYLEDEKYKEEVEEIMKVEEETATYLQSVKDYYLSNPAEYLAAIKATYDDYFDELSRKEEIQDAKAEGISIGEVSGVKKTIIDLLKMIVKNLSPKVLQLLNDCSIDQLDQLKSNFTQIHSEEDIINIINHEE